MSKGQTELLDTWIDDWRDYLQSAGSESEISNEFAKRWASKKPAKVPGGLVPSATADPAADWSHWLEKFLLSDTDGADRHAELLVSAIENAISLGKHSLSNIVWIRDVLALRRVVFGSDETRVRAARLIISSLRTLTGASLNPDPRDYDHYDRLLGVASRAMVAELYEENFAEAWVDGDLNAANFDAFTVLWYLEANRRADVELENTTVWHSIAEDYQSLADEFFMTLIDINAQAMQSGDRVENRNGFLLVLKKFHLKSNSEISNYARFLGLQRKLDVHLVRFSVIVSATHRANASLARKFVVFMSRCDGAIRSQVRRSVLLKGLMIPLRPKLDSRQTILTTASIDADEHLEKIDLIPSDTLDELAVLNSEIAEALEEAADA